MKSKLLLTILFGGLLFESIGQIVSPFSIRTQFSQKGGIRFLANTSVSCGSASGCTSAQNQTPPGGTAQNNNFSMQYVDIDGDASTFMSSSDSLDLPSCSEITWAGLYWSAYSNTSMSNYANRFSVKLKVNNGAYQTLTANAGDRMDNSTGYTSYHAFFDVTSIVQNAGNNARFTIANLVSDVGNTNRWGGWSIVVVYKNDLQPMRNLTVFNGLANVSSGSNSTVDVPISGFLTPLSGPVTFDLGVIAYDGDRSQTGDQLLFNGSGSFVSVSDAIHNVNDVFNSTISYNGALTPNRRPSYNNTLGHDANIFAPDNSSKNYIGNNATSATIRVTTGGETILTHVITSAIDIYEPDLRAAVKVQDLNGGAVEPGDTLEYTVLCKNIGSDPAINTFVTDTIEGNASFVPGSITIVYGPNAGVKTDALSDDQAEYDAASKTVKVRIGTGADGSVGGEILNSPAGNDSTIFTFRVTASTDCVYLQCDNVINNRAFIFGTGNVSGNTFNNGSNPGIFDGNGCPIPGTTSSPINATACAIPAVMTNSPVCIGDTLFLTADSSSSAVYSWTGPNGFTSSAISPSLLISSSGQAGTYTCTVTIPGISCSFNPSANVSTSMCTPPEANTDNGGTIVEDVASATVNIIANDTDVDGNPAPPTNNAGQFTVDIDTALAGVQLTQTTSAGVWTYDPVTGNVTFEPAANFSGTASVVYQLCDPEGNCDTATIIFTVTPVNDSPVVNNETATTNEDTPITVNVLGNDSDPDNDSLVISSVVYSGNGTVTIYGDSVIYTPNANFNGTDTLIVSVCDTVTPPLCVNDTIFVTVNPINDAPVIDNEYITTNEDTPVNGDLTDAGDSDVDGNLVVNTTPTSGPNHGTIIINADGTYTYTPGVNYNGPDTVIVQICDDGTPLPANCVNDTIFITVNPVNDSPVVNNETATTNEDTPITVNVLGNDSDPDNDSLVISSVVYSGNGTVTIYGDSVIYTPNANFNGTDTLIVSVCDTVTPPLCVNDTIFVTVNPINDAPVIDNEYITTNEDTPVNGDLTDAGDSDVDGNLVVNTTPTSGPNHGTIIINADGTYTYTPGVNYNGPDTVIVQICDDGTPLPANCVNDTIFITVNPVNDSPVVNNETATTNEDTPITVNVLGNDSDPDNDSLVISSVVYSGNGTVTIYGDSVIYTPNANFNGTDTLIVSVCDTVTPPLCVNDTIFVTVNPVNDVPVIDNEYITTNEDTPVNGDLTDAGDSDVDGNLVVNTTPTSGPNHGTIIINADGTYTYTPGTNYNGPDTVIVQICDDGTPLPANCVNDTIFITVNPVNDSPVVNNETATTNEDTPITVNVLGNDSDPDNDSLVISSVVYSGNGTVTIYGDSVIYTPNANFNGTDTLIVSVCDTVTPPLCVNDTIFVTVNPVNDVPVIDNEYITTNEDTPVNGDLTDAGDSDVDGNLVVNTTPTSGPNHGTIIINADGTYTYTPGANYNGPDTVIVQICDDGTPLPANCVNDTIFITVNPVNDAPVVDNEYDTTNVDIPVNGDLTDAGDSDVDGNLVVNTTPVSGLNYGTIIINSDGTYTYTPDGSTVGTDTVIVQICDDGTPLPANCVNDTIFIVINPCSLLVANSDCDGDGVTNGQETVDGTDPNDPCDLLVANQNTTASNAWLAADCDNDGLTNGEETTGVDDPSTPANPNGNTSNPLNPDTDGDGVTDTQEATDGTDVNDPCDYQVASITLPQTGAWLTADCDGDGVTNGQEVTDGTSPNDPCDLFVASQNTTASTSWLTADCDNDGLTNGEETTGVDDPSTPANPNGNTTDPLNPDTDGDGVTDGQEAIDGTNPNDPCDDLAASVTLAQTGDWLTADCDNDGLTNGEETTGVDDPSTPANPNGNTTDPLNPDTDGDGVTDTQETADGTDPNDPCDLILANQNTTINTAWLNTDCDNDGLTNGEETSGVDDPSTPANPNGNTTDPLNPDTDGDGVTDGQEAVDGTNPNDPCEYDPNSVSVTPSNSWMNADCDNDGLTNGEETTGVDDPSTPANPNGNTTDPLNPDTDGDGVTDTQEITDGTNPNDPCEFLTASITLPQTGAWLTADCDGDGVTNGQEVTDGTNPDDPCDLLVTNQNTTASTSWLTADCDNDGLTNGEEATGLDDPSTPANPNGNTTDPLNPDTDGDGVTDGQEAIDGTNPNDPCEYLANSVSVTPSTNWMSEDCDNDGLTNGEETTGVDDPSTPANPNGNTTDPGNPDTDGDGVTDGQEAADGTNPNDPCEYEVNSVTVAPSNSWMSEDCDNDGLTNGEEATGVDDPSTPANPNGNTTDPLNPDTDGDGVTDGQEAVDATNPNDPCAYLATNVTLPQTGDWLTADCDGDGISNGEEVQNGSDPSNPCSPNACGVKVPEAFTPDGDGINDVLVIEGALDYANNEITIYNRWGNVVYHTTNYQNTWDGTSANGMNAGGDALPTGTYFYIFDTKDDLIGVVKGYIYLQR